MGQETSVPYGILVLVLPLFGTPSAIDFYFFRWLCKYVRGNATQRTEGKN
jgi:hypothetical protein